MMYPAISLAQQVVQACKAKGIRHIVLSPGSRNAPLTIGFTSDAYFQCYSIVDERCAGFFALGIAQQIATPVAVVCTSGSALVNYYPAVTEGFYSNYPLVVISADRPSSKIDIGDGQTIRQMNVLANHTAYNANLSDEDALLSFNEYELNQALNICIERQLPVHINAPFEEPLYHLTTKCISFANIPLYSEKKSLSEEYLSKFIADWNASKKKIVLIGILKPNSIEQKWIDFFKEDPSVLVLTENLSNVVDDAFISMLDTFLFPIQNSKELEGKLRPELLISFGGMLISKRVKDFFRKNPPKSHFHIDLYSGYDTFYCLTHHFEEKVGDFFEKVSGKLKKVHSNYHLEWYNFMKVVDKYRKSFLDDILYSDMWVYQSIFNHLPKEIHLQISNSAPIRYAQFFPQDATWDIFCNRGTSGIDGSTSTAIGASLFQEKQTIFLTGDLSFYYNSNALWCKYTPASFRIILVNNDGGGIFRLLPADKGLACFEPYFETPHHLTANYLCEMYGWEYEKVESKEEMEEKLSLFLKESGRPKLLEVFTPRKENDKVFSAYFQYLKELGNAYIPTELSHLE